MELTLGDGTVVESYRYDAFGAPTIYDRLGQEVSSPPSGNPFLFTGREYDPETGLYHYRARTYDPATGTFLQEDPLGYREGLNPIAYVSGNPINLLDPSGLSSLGSAIEGLIDFLVENRALVGELALSVLGPLGDIIDLISAVIGKDFGEWMTNGFQGRARSLSWWERVTMGIGGATRALGGAFAALSKIKKIRKTLDKMVAAAKSRAARRAARRAEKAASKIAPGCKTRCFAQGTLVLLAGGLWIPIEEVDLGEALATREEQQLERVDIEEGLAPDQHAWVDPASWVEITLTGRTESGSPLRAQILRPRRWWELQGAAPGDRLSLAGLEGEDGSLELRVARVAPCPEVEEPEGGGGLVLGRFEHWEREALALEFAGSEVPLVTTPGHPFFSESRGRWVASEELRAGEWIETHAGPAQLQAKTLLPGPIQVINLEIHHGHTYFAGEVGAWVHNTCPRGVNGGGKASKVSKSKTTESIGGGKFTKTTEVRPGKGPGQSRAEYVRIKNADGKTIRTYKDSYDRGNKFQGRKPLRGGPEGRPKWGR